MNEKIKVFSKIAKGIILADDVISFLDLVMKQIPNLIPCEKSIIEYGIRENEEHIFRSLTMTKEELDNYRDYYFKYDYTAWYLEQSDISVYRDSDIVSQQVMDNAIIYNEWVTGMGMKFVCGNVLRFHENRIGDLTLFRSEQYGDYTDEEMELFSYVTELMNSWIDKHYIQSEEIGKILPRTNAELTPREMEIAELIVQGYSTREVSEKLVITYSTTRRHLSNIYEKLKISNRVQLVQLFNK